MSKQVKKHKSRLFRRFVRANEAVSALEYAILVGVIAMGVGAAIVAFGGDIKTAMTNIGNKIDDVKVSGGNTNIQVP